jgi:hypothetical protein
LCNKISRDIQILTIGVNSTQRIKAIFKAANCHKIYILNQAAYVQSRRGVLSEGRVRDITTNRNTLFEKNVLYFNKTYTKMNEIYKRKGGIR